MVEISSFFIDLFHLKLLPHFSLSFHICKIFSWNSHLNYDMTCFIKQQNTNTFPCLSVQHLICGVWSIEILKLFLSFVCVMLKSLYTCVLFKFVMIWWICIFPFDLNVTLLWHKGAAAYAKTIILQIIYW